MTYQVRAVTTPGWASGFRLAGLHVDELRADDDSETISAQLRAAANREETGILLVDERLLTAASPTLRHELERRARPILVPMPAVSLARGEAHAEDFILELLRRAIGYRVRLP